MSKPIFVENETNAYNLRFLMDNVRPSEDVAIDNHIYLYYEKPELFYCAMQIMDLRELIESHKAVFLMGQDNKANYPIDFKARFNIDYSVMPKRAIKAGDIKRVILQWTIQGASGHGFLAEIMDYHPNLLTHPDATLEYYHDLYEFARNREPDELIDNFFDLPEDNAFRKEISKLICIVDKYEGEQKKTEIQRYLNTLKSIVNDVSLTSISGWLKVILFAFNIYKGREFNDRIFPAFYYYPHMARDHIPYLRNFYTMICEDFPSYCVLVSIRDPISVASSWAISVIDRKSTMAESPSAWWIQSQVFGWLSYYRNKNDTIYKKGVIIRFEDLKLNFPAMIQSIISYLNITYSDSLERTTRNGIVPNMISSTRENFRDGFDITPVYAHVRNDKYLSEYDKYRIEMIISEYYSHFGYAAKFYDGKKYTLAEAERIMNESWLCDQLEIERGIFTKDEILSVRERTAHYWKNCLNNPTPADNDILPMRVLEPVLDLLVNELYA